MQNTFTKIGLSFSLLMLAGATNAQMQPATDTVAEFKPSGKLWGYGFGDYAYKGGTDEAVRGGSNQYTKVPVNANEFQWRRLYLGYDYNISPKFSAEFLLAAEDDWAAGVEGQTANSANTTTGALTTSGNGDVLMNTKFAPYIKLANIRWKNIYKGADLVIGQSATPSFAKNGSGMASEEVWGYRSIERTITDIRRTSSFDMGASLQGKLGDKGNFGYVLMFGNGNGAKPEGDMYKCFYGDIWAKFINKKLIVDLYQDYQKMDWGTWVGNVGATATSLGAASPNGPLYHDRNMTKLFVAYVVPKFTVGVEYFMNTLMGDVKVTGVDKNSTGNNNIYYRTTKATGLSVFVKGRITKETLGFFARFDNYDPTGNLKSIVDDKNTKSYTALTSQYDPTNKEMFGTFGIDYTPIKHVHIMPNIWVNTYSSGVSPTATNPNGVVYGGDSKAAKPYTTMNSGISGINGTDVVYRLTFFYVYGK